MKWKPEVGQLYFSSVIDVPEKYLEYTCRNDVFDVRNIENNNCFQTKEEAIAATDLCLSALRGELVRREDVIKKIVELRGVINNELFKLGLDSVIKAVEEL